MELINGRTEEEIKAAVINCDEHCSCIECPEDERGYCDQSVVIKYARCLIERIEAAVPRWISVEERLPEGECIAIGWQDEMLIGYVYRSGTGYACESDGEYLMDVTHWMPLPEPPKEGAHE